MQLNTAQKYKLLSSFFQRHGLAVPLAGYKFYASHNLRSVPRNRVADKKLRFTAGADRI